MSQELRQIIDDLAVPLDLEWSDDLSKKNYSEALKKIDAFLIDHPDDLNARLWWVQCQAESGSVPPTALSAPLEEILPKLKEENRLFEGSVAAFLRISLQLLEKKQTKLAALLLERAYDFAKKGRSLPVESREQIRETLLTTLKQERERAELKREAKPYISSIDSRIAEYSKHETESPKAESVPQVKRNSRLSSASVLEAALTERDQISDVPAAKVEERHTGAAILISLLGGLMIILGLLFSKVLTPQESNLEERLAINLMPSGFPSLVLPSVEFSESGGSLDSVSKRLERMRKDKEQAATQNLTWNGPTPTAAPTALPPPPVITRAPITREERQKIPEMNPERLATAVVQSLGRTVDQGPIAGNIVRGPDGRIYGPPPSDPSARSLDGLQLQPVEVDQLGEPKMYKIIASTAVFSAPSVVAQAVAKLEVGAKVQVVAKMGKWLELRSSGGRRGYIYAQDAEMVDR